MTVRNLTKLHGPDVIFQDVTFVIDQRGIVRHRFSSAVRMQAHVDEAIDTVRSLKA